MDAVLASPRGEPSGKTLWEAHHGFRKEGLLMRRHETRSFTHDSVTVYRS